VTTVGEDLEQARVDGLLGVLRDAEAELRRAYSRMLGVVGELEEENAGAAAGFGTTARLLAGVLNLSRGEAKARVEHSTNSHAPVIIDLVTECHDGSGEY